MVLLRHTLHWTLELLLSSRESMLSLLTTVYIDTVIHWCKYNIYIYYYNIAN